jgi:hypothetical protein
MDDDTKIAEMAKVMQEWHPNLDSFDAFPARASKISRGGKQ